MRTDTDHYRLSCLRREHAEIISKLDDALRTPDIYLELRKELDWNEVAQEKLRGGKST